MKVDQIVTPANIVAGALVSQVSIVVIMFLAAAVFRRDSTLVRWYKDQPTYAGFSWLILALFLSTVGMLAASEPFAATWSPLFSSMPFEGLSWSSAILLVFFADIAALTHLVAGTGGSLASPFQPLYFLLPTLALLLREPASRVLIYAVLVAVSFVALLFHKGTVSTEDSGRHRLAYGLVSLLCLVLTCLIGIYARQPM